MNRCRWCGKFAPWRALVPQIEYTMDLHGNVTQKDYFEHA